MKRSFEIIIAGFGGQGVMSLGQIIAYSAMMEGKEVTFMPSYGPEMRGGTANCIVVISDSRISSPIVSEYDAAFLLSQPSIERFEKKVYPHGIILYEQSTIVHPPQRDDVEIVGLPGIAEAEKLHAKQVANMILLGAFLERKPILRIENVFAALKSVLPPHRQHLLLVNEQALIRGKELVKRTEEIVTK